MPISTLKLRPGVDVEQSPVLLEAGWSQSNRCRFFDGLIQKLGGWAHLNAQPLVGIATGMHAWSDLSATPYIAIGTDQRLQLFAYGLVYDITPLEKTVNISPSFSTTSTSKTVTVTNAANGAEVGDWIFIPVPVSVGGIIIQGFYRVQTVVDANNYTITAISAATSTVSNGGAVPVFDSTNTSPNVKVTLANHGLAAGALFGVQVQTTVGGIVIAVGTYAILASPAPTTNNFYIAPGTAAGSTQTVSENSGNVRISYLVPSGFQSATLLGGYGAGTYGSGLYGGSNSSTVFGVIRQWFLDNWGQDLIGNYTGSPIYVWAPPLTVTPSEMEGNVAVAIDGTNFPGATDPPVQVNASFVAMPEQIMIALGVDPAGGGTQDPNLIRWCSVADFTDWLASAVNQAGSFRLPNGSKIVGGIQGPLFAVISTDVDVWLMQYLGAPFVFGFDKISVSADWISARCAGIFNSNVYWMTNQYTVVYDGNSVHPVPCPVWDKFFYNLNRNQKDKIVCGVNSWFGEVTWYYPSASGNGTVDSYITFCARESEASGRPIWVYGSLDRTAWIDDNVYGSPIGADNAGMLQQHEIGFDADGQTMLESATSGYFSLQDGEFITFLERTLPNFTWQGTNPQLQYYILVTSYGTDTPVQYGPFTATPTGPEYDIIRARGRFAAIKLQGVGTGTFWRWGGFKASLARLGKRP